MSREELEKYLWVKGAFTIAEVQQKFSLSYAEVRQIFKEMEQKGTIYLESGVTFRYVPNKTVIEEVSYTDVTDTEEDEDDDFDIDFQELFNDEEDDDDNDEEEDNDFTWKMSSTTIDLSQAIIDKLKVFGIKVEIAETIVGASVTRYIFSVRGRTRLSEIKKYAEDIKSCTGSDYPVRIVESAGSKIAIEVVNQVKALVTLDSILTSEQFRSSKGKLDFALGQDLNRNNVIADLSQLPHLLIAGATGTGKSCVLSSMIVSLAQKYSPDYVRFLLVDPKFVELSKFNGIPHMLTGETITNHDDTLSALDYLINEMESRYMLMRQTGTGNIVEYKNKTGNAMPYIVFVMDELADIMSACKNEFEVKLQRLAQKSRAAGIHIVLATQRPDVRVITGTVKANMPARVGLKMYSIFDSNTAIGGSGCECLAGNGDMLYLSPASCELQRVQGAFVSSEEIYNIVNALKKQYPAKFDAKIGEKPAPFKEPKKVTKEAVVDANVDPLCKKALRYWLEKQKGRASIASIQRNLGIGFNRAGRIMDTLQQLGFVEEYVEGQPMSRPLRVLVELEDLDRLFPDSDD